MPLKDYLLKEIDFLRDKRNQLFTIFFTLISGSIALVVYVILGERPLFALFIAFLGFMLAIIPSKKIYFYDKEIKKRLKELKETE